LSRITVGTAVASRPPDRSVRECLPVEYGNVKSAQNLTAQGYRRHRPRRRVGAVRFYARAIRLIKLTATLCRIFPKLKCDYPQDEQGELIPRRLPEDQWKAFQGVLGHYHVQKNKTDPGPAFDWEKVVSGAQKLLKKSR